MKTIKRTIGTILLLLLIIIANACYWLVSDIQTRCVEKIAQGQETSLYEKASILSLHMGICTAGYLYCPDAAWANMQMLLTRKDTIYLHSDSWLSPQIRQRFRQGRLGRMAWNGNTDYALSSPEKDTAILLNWCTLDIRSIDGRQSYVAQCDYTWRQPSRTTFSIAPGLSITVYEQLFFELEKAGILKRFLLVCHWEKE